MLFMFVVGVNWHSPCLMFKFSNVELADVTTATTVTWSDTVLVERTVALAFLEHPGTLHSECLGST